MRACTKSDNKSIYIRISEDFIRGYEIEIKLNGVLIDQGSAFNIENLYKQVSEDLRSGFYDYLFSKNT